MEFKREEKQNIKKDPKKNLIIFDKDLNVIKLTSLSNIYQENNKYPNDKFYIEADLELFFSIKELLSTNKITFTKNPIQEKITTEDIECIPKPSKPPTSEEVIKKTLSTQEKDIETLNKKVEEFTNEFIEISTIQKRIEEKINSLSEAVIKLATKGSI